MFDGKAFGTEVVDIVKSHIDKTFAPIMGRLDALERRFEALPVPKDGTNGKDANSDEVAGLVFLRLHPELESIKALVDEAKPDMEVLEASIVSHVTKAVEALPAPKDGDPGKDADPVEIERIISERVERAIAGLPKAKDGVGAAGAMIDREGQLILTMTDGSVHKLGAVVGKDGTAGPAGKNGFELKDFDVTSKDEGRTIVLSFESGDIRQENEIHNPVILYRGTFKEGQTYKTGDTVTWAGSSWHCQEETADKPGESKSWVLMVKRGRDGKNGDPGKDFTPPKPVKVS